MQFLKDKLENKKKICFCAFGFAPGHFELMKDYFSILENDYVIVFYLSKEYLDYCEEFFRQKVIILSNNNQFPTSCFDLWIIFSPNILNNRLFKRIKRSGSKILYLYHEPYTGLLKTMMSLKSFGPRSFMQAIGRQIFNGRRVVFQADGILLFSKFAKDNFSHLFHPYLRKTYIMPLSYDLPSGIPDPSGRFYFAFLGGATTNRGFYQFCRFAMETTLTVPFLIATRKRINQKLVQKLKSKCGNRITIYSGSVLSDAKMSRFYRESIAVWMGYYHSTQSGVMGSCYRQGTPVIATRIGGFIEDVNDGVTGRFIDDYSEKTINGAFTDILKNIGHYSTGAYNYFLEHYYYKKHSVQLNQIVDDLLSKENVK